MCVKGTDTMARIVTSSFQKARVKTVECVFSPFEADAQLVKLVVDGHAHAVVTEDSDILVYSASCRVAFPIILKLDRSRGSCQIINMDWLLSSSILQPSQISNDTKKKNTQKKASTFLTTIRSFAFAERQCAGQGVRLFVQACVLSGCDYVANTINGVGLVHAFSLVNQHSHVAADKRFHTILQSKAVPDLDNYEKLLSKSEVVFYHHIVKDLNNMSGNLVPLIIPGSMSILPGLKRFGSILDFVGTNALLSYAPFAECDETEDVSISLSSSSSQSITCIESSSNATSCKQKTSTFHNPLAHFAFPGSDLMRKNKLYTSKKDNAIDDNGNKSLTNAIFSNIQVSNDSESHNKPKNEEYNNRKRNEQPSMLSPAVSTPKVQKKKRTVRQVTLYDSEDECEDNNKKN